MMKKRKTWRADVSRKAMELVNNDPTVSVICDNFLGVNWFEKVKVFPVFTIYYNPKDFPKKYVVRLFDGDKPMRLLAVKDTLEQARATIPKEPPFGFMRVNRDVKDDPAIVETWL